MAQEIVDKNGMRRAYADNKEDAAREVERLDKEKKDFAPHKSQTVKEDNGE